MPIQKPPNNSTSEPSLAAPTAATNPAVVPAAIRKLKKRRRRPLMDERAMVSQVWLQVSTKPLRRGQHLTQPGKAQADHVGITAIQAINAEAAATLEGKTTGALQWFSTGHIRLDQSRICSGLPGAHPVVPIAVWMGLLVLAMQAISETRNSHNQPK